MRVLPEALVAQARRRLGRGERTRRPRLRVYRRSPGLSALSPVLGALVGAGYAGWLLPHAAWQLYVTSAVGGACAFYLALAIPRLTWFVLRRQWLVLSLRLSRDRLAGLLEAAREVLGNPAGDLGLGPRERASDLAVVDCLDGNVEGAVPVLRALCEEECGLPEFSNLLLALAETEQWDEVAGLLEQEDDGLQRLTDAALARVAAHAPPGALLERLWKHARRAECSRTLNNLGVRSLENGDLVRAEEALTRAAELRPSYALAHANLGVLAYRREDHVRAVGETASATMFEPGEASLFTNLGALLCQAGDPRAARRALGRALAMSPGGLEALVNLGAVHAVAGRLEEATDALQEAARSGQQSAAHHNAALVLAAKEELEPALESQRAACELAPDDPEVLNNLGCFLWVGGQYVEAEPHFARAAQTRYNDISRGNLIRADLALGRSRRVLHLLQQTSYAEEDMDFDRGLAYLLAAAQASETGGPAAALLDERDLAEAAARFRRVIETGRDAVVEASIDLGVVEYLEEQFEEAAEAFAKAGERSPTTEELNFVIATCYLVAAERMQIRDAEQHGELVPRAREWVLKARPYLEKALGVRSVADAARLNLAVSAYLLGDFTRTVTTLRPIARADSSWQIQNLLAIAQARQARELEKLIHTSPLLGAVRKRQIAADIRKLLSAAIHAFTQVLRQQPRNPVVHANIGLAHYLRNRGNDVEEALRYWQRMRGTGELGERIYEMFTVAMSSSEGHRLRFQDVEIGFQPVPARDWITCAPPRLVGLQYVIRALSDIPPAPLVARHPLVKRALACRDRAERLRVALQRLAT